MNARRKGKKEGRKGEKRKGREGGKEGYKISRLKLNTFRPRFPNNSVRIKMCSDCETCGLLNH